MPWYVGPALLPYLESVDIETKEEVGFYMPIQRVSRPNHTFRGFQGEVQSGTIHVGEEIKILPSGETAKIKSIIIGFETVESATKNQPVSIQLDREVDVSRGCVFYKGTDLNVSAKVDINLLWMDDSELREGTEYWASIGTKIVSTVVTKIRYKVDVNNGERLQADELHKNEIAHVVLKFQEPVVVDTFENHKGLSELILIDRVTHMTSACGTVLARLDDNQELYTFVNGAVKARGDIFEEFFYDIEGFNVNKEHNDIQVYKVGDRIPIQGESYSYPVDFDILVLRDKVAVKVRDSTIIAIESLREYTYQNLPLLNGRGFSINIQNSAVYDIFKQSLDTDEAFTVQWYNTWLNFGTYRRIVFKK